MAPQTDVAVELGGEDAKILYFKDGADTLRMNEACAGGTGAFIDQMASLLHTDAAGLNRLAAKHTRIYPIASRCGVFAKTDVVPLLNEGVAREDLAASIFQAVVEQTIGGLACGHPIKGKVAFLGGPLHFLPELRARFIETLSLSPEAVVDIPDAHYIVAFGAALSLVKLPNMPSDVFSPLLSLSELAEQMRTCKVEDDRVQTLPPLFESNEEYEAFTLRHKSDAVPRSTRENARGPLFLGVDLGSTTVKTVLIDAGGAVLATWYCNNQGDPLASLLPYVADLIDSLPHGKDGSPAAWIESCVSTGYGAGLARAALGADSVEVETVAHLKAACHLIPDASYVIDIGGQDMKCLKANNGYIAGVTLNEACSAGCGAFLETFAKNLNLSMNDFVQAALFARHPVDLGSRCTVFMNSKVKQAQKEGAEIGDIAAGLCYSVIRNALYKVLRLRKPEELGDKVIVQGGSFMNDALLRVMERLLGREVFRPDIAGLMGAYGAALLAMRHRSGHNEDAPYPIQAAMLRNLSVTTRPLHCRSCTNHCRLMLHIFSNGRKFVSGNRCERGSAAHEQAGGKKTAPMPNLYAWKNQRLFDYMPLSEEDAPRGRIGIPRVLNMYEYFPYWFTLFTTLGFRVELSPASGKKIFDLGLSSMPSQTVCYPAKMAHGHVMALIYRGIKRIFYPCMPLENSSDDSRYNCPVVSGYPEVVRLNTDELRDNGIELYTPFVSLAVPDKLARVLHELFDIPRNELLGAIRAAELEQQAYRNALHAEGERVLAEIKRTGGLGIVLCGRPYHVDPAIHHGLAEYIASLGVAVLSEDSIAHLGTPKEPLRVVDQWSYHSRLYKAASIVCSNPLLELVQLTSFGCGLDAITSDQIAEILARGNRLHTLIKIDEGTSLGAARIRIRSLLAAVWERREERGGSDAITAMSSPVNVVTGTGSEGHTILVPQMAPLHFSILEKAFTSEGFRLELLPSVSPKAIETGLAYVHNDACYPAVVVIGQLLEALRSGAYDPSRTSMMLAQTCGPCRASNYAALLRKALCEAGFSNVPVMTIVNSSATARSDIKLTLPLFRKLIIASLYGDILQRVSMHVRSNEACSGRADNLLAGWVDRVSAAISAGELNLFKRHVREIVRDFAAVPLDDAPRPKVGIVGEILLKYHPDANNNIAHCIMEAGGEPVSTDLTDFFLYCAFDPIYRWRHLGGKFLPALSSWLLIRRVEALRRYMRKALEGSPFMPLASIADLASSVKGIISCGHQAGEGWLLTAEILEFINHGVNNVLCLQPFGCLPNHITGKGVMKELKRQRAGVNLMALDYDPGTSLANQLNRIKLFMSVANVRLQEELERGIKNNSCA